MTASGAHRALALLKQYQFDFALLDVMMAGMSRLELLAEMRELHPDVGARLLVEVDEPAENVGQAARRRDDDARRLPRADRCRKRRQQQDQPEPAAQPTRRKSS